MLSVSVHVSQRAENKQALHRKTRYFLMTDERNQWLLHPFSWYRTMRENNPVFRNEEYGSWGIFRYEDIERVLSDYTSFSAEGRMGDSLLSNSIISIDPPRHRKLRTLVTQAFTPRRIALLEPRIAALV